MTDSGLMLANAVCYAVGLQGIPGVTGHYGVSRRKQGETWGNGCLCSSAR
ncbi:MAG: hypothetical protein ACLT2T_08345 [Bilophila wadsworthia]